MRTTLLLAAGALALGVAAQAASAQGGSVYTAKNLLDICQEGDNASRMVGQIAEIECEQYVRGYVEALIETGGVGEKTGICPPEQNTADEVRWAFARWAHKSYTERTKMTASAALLATLKDSFACK